MADIWWGLNFYNSVTTSGIPCYILVSTVPGVSMKKYLISFFIPWLLFYFMGCYSSQSLTIEEALVQNGNLNIHLTTADKRYLLPRKDNFIPIPNPDAEEIYCIGCKFNQNDITLIYDYLTPTEEPNKSIERRNTVNIDYNNITALYYDKFDYAATFGLIAGVILVVGLIAYEIISNIDLTPSH